MPTFTAHLRSSSDEALAVLLARRPDLASPFPGNLTSLAVRATGRASLERALAGVDAVVVQVLEAVVALGGATHAAIQEAVAGGPDDEVARATDEGLALALLHPDDEGALVLAPGVAELLGAHPAGLALEVAGPADPTALPSDDDPLAAPARAVLDALTWGPPVGLAPGPGSPAGDAVAMLVARRLLVRGAGRHVLLPASVALALRGGRTHRGVAVPPDLTQVPHRSPATVAAESASAGERCVRLVARLLRAWEQDPPGVLRAGGLAVRELRRTAATLEVDEREAAFVVELAFAAGLLAVDDDEPAVFAPTTDADAWSTLDLPQRWVALASAWLATTRTPWLVGSRDERGSLIAALDPELARPWAPRLRRAVLGVLAREPGRAPGADAVVDALGWATPRTVPPRSAVEAVLTEASRLGASGAGALSDAARALLDAGGDGAGVQAAAVFAAGLAPEVGDLLLQGDLTGIVPGRPAAELEALLERAAVVESRGGAVTVRFTPESVRRALDDGLTADELVERLTAFARGGIPQALDYLVRDAARRHGRLRAGAASSYLRADDPALLAGLADDPRLADLGLVQLAPTVLAAQASTHELVETLRAHGLSPVAEAPDGQVLHLERTVRRARRRGSRRTAAPVVTRTTDTAALVRRLRSSDQHPTPDATDPAAATPAPARSPAPGPGTDDPAAALALLREAAAARENVWVELVGPQGRPERRLLRPLRVEGGRLRAADPVRESELTVAVHRIGVVQRATDDSGYDQDHDQEVT
ncbi:helicase-associated domain-containing protein [Cellulomonas palmilytica]|uniref:helicase-associated domain-containing protein n=1 Tax=Cellulomonas palmilytica TaxID=2608402 RepID=UPI001F482AAA|nr:helicase-associated domain-containing protein [Cellulomonas palmilytica]UJP41000.1 helicase-associated domain-containing protein [Cellulomonas palmilytica]